MFHLSWRNDDVDLSNKAVIVMGTECSAAHFAALITKTCRTQSLVPR